MIEETNISKFNLHCVTVKPQNRFENARLTQWKVDGDTDYAPLHSSRDSDVSLTQTDVLLEAYLK